MTGKPRHRRKWARARHRSAHKLGPRRAKPRGRLEAPDVYASLRQSPAPTNNLPPPHDADNPDGDHPRAIAARIAPIAPTGSGSSSQEPICRPPEPLRNPSVTRIHPQKMVAPPLTFIRRHKRASGACRFLANSLVEAVVSARSRSRSHRHADHRQGDQTSAAAIAHPGVRRLGASRLLRLSRVLRPRYAFATHSAVVPRAGGRLHGPDDAQVEPREVAVGRRAIAFVGLLTTGSPRLR